ncbi:MAG: class I SAM-dependent methyltransferase [Actinobacteria bacterium]|nr:MAG: class I SAM-dependent methyltransferase [Actinomycetota bacterium]
MPDQQLYDRIGRDYASIRKADRRWAAAILSAVGNATTVLNVGAGAGSYEPTDRPVIALDPSATMLRQRARNAAPAMAAAAEAIPCHDGAFDCTTAILTIHHWTNWRAGLAEVKRVTRRRIVVLTADVFRDDEPFWLKEYFPGINAWDRAHIQPIDDVLQELWPARVERLPVPADCTDGFCGAYWRRPAAYLRPEVRNGISGFSQIGDRETEQGLSRLQADLDSGVWNERYGGLLDRDEIDIGYGW